MNGRQTYNPTEQEVHSPMRDTAESSVLYSFDVFDTVLCRACVEPEGVFKYVQQEMERSESLFDSRFRRRYVSTRRWAEEICREVKRRERTNARATCDGPTLVPTEISFDEIFECMEWVYGLDRQQTDLLKEWELAAERRFSMPVEHNVHRVKDLMEAGEEVVFISDMYLPEAFVRELLTAADVSFGDIPLFLSSSIGLQKSTGELYDYIARTRGRSYDSWIHVGDNPTADVRRPRKLGIKAERYDPGVSFGPYERALADSLGTCDALLAAGLFARFASDGASVEDDFAYRYASLYFVPYIEWVLAHALDQGVECLYFISRDGHLLKAIADAVIAERALPLRTRYILGSRKAWRIPSQIDEVDEAFFSAYGNFTGVYDFDALVEASGISSEQMLDLFPELEALKHAGKFEIDIRNEVVKLLRDSQEYRQLLLDAAREKRELACRYLRQEIDFSERFAFVEYWGRGYTQDCLSKLLGAAGAPENGSVFYYMRSVSRTEGDNVRHVFTCCAKSLLFVEALFANHPYAAVSGYEERDGRVIAVREPQAYNEPLFRALERQLPAFAVDFDRLDVRDREGLCRDLAEFGLVYFAENPCDKAFLTCIAPLRDAVSIYGEPIEYAPEWTVPDMVRKVRGIELPTSNGKMSLARSRLPFRVIYRGYEVAKRSYRERKEKGLS